MMMQMMKNMMSSAREKEKRRTTHACPLWKHKKISSLGSSVLAENSEKALKKTTKS